MTRLRLILGVLLILAIIGAGTYIALDALDSGTLAPPPSPPPAEDPSAEDPSAEDPAEKPAFDCTVGLYTGQGSWDVDLEALRNFLAAYELDCVEIDQETASSGDLNALCDILIFVGGASAEYRAYLGNHANISSFVEKGGSFVGFCAGAYYAASTMRWQGKTFDYPLKLFPGEAAGPYLPWGSLATMVLNPDLEFQQEFSDTLGMWYFGGPCFNSFSETEVEVLARYQANNEAAVIAFPFGRGAVLLLGPHPELGYNPSEELVHTGGEGGAQWRWLYASLQWLMDEKKA